MNNPIIDSNLFDYKSIRGFIQDIQGDWIVFAPGINDDERRKVNVTLSNVTIKTFSALLNAND